MRMMLALLALVFLALPARAEKILDVQEIVTPAGIRLWLVEDHSVPVITVSFSFEGGLGFDPDDKPGVGRMVSILLDEGAGALNGQQFQKELADHAIGMQFTAGRDAFYGELRTLAAHKAKAFDLLSLALTKPRFDADAIVRMRNSNTATIRRDMGDPSWLSARTFNGMMFEGHYYAKPGYGDLESMRTITRNDLVAYVRDQFARDVLTVSIAGDISRADAAAAVDKIFGGLAEKAGTLDHGPAQLAHAGKTIRLTLDTPQTYIVAGGAGISRKDPDWHAALIVNYIFGGGSFDARLMKEIREKRGLTYGVYTALSSMRHADIIQTNLSVSNDKVKEALDTLKAEWARMAKDGPTEQELADAKAYITGSLLLDLTSTDDIAGTLSGLQRDGQDAAYINRRNDLINAVTPADAKRVAARLFRPDELTIVLVGNPAISSTDILLDKPPGMRSAP